MSIFSIINIQYFLVFIIKILYLYHTIKLKTVIMEDLNYLVELTTRDEFPPYEKGAIVKCLNSIGDYNGGYLFNEGETIIVPNITCGVFDRFHWISMSMHITSNENIIFNDFIIFCGGVYNVVESSEQYVICGDKNHRFKKSDCRKIVLSNDIQLNLKGIPSIPNKFISDYIERPSSFEVKDVLFIEDSILDGDESQPLTYNVKIITDVLTLVETKVEIEY